MATRTMRPQAEVKARREKRRKAIARAIELRQKGETIAYIAEQIGVVDSTVWLWLKLHAPAATVATQQKAS